MASTSPTIFHVCADRGIDPSGTKGAAIHLRSLAAALSTRCRTVLFAARHSTPALDLGDGRSIPITTLDGADTIVAAASVLGAPDAVYERYSLGSIVGLEAARALGVPFVLEVNAPLQLEASRHRPESVSDESAAIERRLFAEADLVIAVSGPLRDHVAASRPHGATIVVPNGCDPSAFAEPVAPDERPTLAFLGHPKPWHGADRLVPILQRVRRQAPDARLLVVGGGDGADAVGAAAADAGLSAAVEITGALSHHDAARRVASAWVGLAPYHPDDFFYFCPLKVVEYMAAGLPVVASRLGDIPDLVGDAGVLVDADDVDSMADAAAALVAAPTTRESMGRRGRERAMRELTWDAAATTTLSAIAGVSGPNRAR